MVNYEYPPLGGGGGVIFRDLAEELAKSVEVTVLTSGCDGLPMREQLGGVEVIRTPVWMRRSKSIASIPSMLSFFPSSLRSGRRLLSQRSFDLVHSAFAVPTGPSGLLLARRAGVPHVLSVLGGDIFDPSKKLSPHKTPLLKQTVRWVVLGSDVVIAESTDLVRRAEELCGARNVERIPLAVKPIPVERLSRGDLGLGLTPDHIVLIAIGRLIARKGLEQLIEVAAAVGDSRVRVLIVGEGPKRAELEAQARAAGIADRLLFTGFVSDERKWQLLAISDICVSTSQHEGFGIALLEGMVSGLPVVCYKCGGPSDFVTAEAGHLIPLGDTNAFREKLHILCSDAETRSQMGEAARKEADKYRLDELAKRYLGIYERCLGRGAV